jgi:hypothetical protein
MEIDEGAVAFVWPYAVHLVPMTFLVVRNYGQFVGGYIYL